MSIVNHIKYGSRTLRRNPSFSISVVLILGLTVGGLSAVGAATWSLLFKPLPFYQPDRLVSLGAFSNQMGFEIGLSPAMILELRSSGDLGNIAASSPGVELIDNHGGSWESATISDNMTDVVGIQPLFGRGFTPDDAVSGAPPVSLISESAWQVRYGGDRSVVGTEIEFESGPVRIVGVMPDALFVPASNTQLWMPMIFNPDELTAPGAIMDMNNLGVIARIPGDTSVSTTADKLQALYGPDERLAMVVESLDLQFFAEPLQDYWSRERRQSLGILVLATAALLLAATLNLAGLWMARWLGRGHEVAVNIAVGSGRWLAVTSTAAEFIILSVPALLVAMVTSVFGTQALFQLGILNVDLPVSVKFGATTVILGIAVLALAAIPVLLAVAWQTRDLYTNTAVLLHGGGATARPRGHRGRRLVVVGEIALTMVLVSVVGLLLKSWMALLSNDVGFQPRGLVHAAIYGPDGEGPGRFVPDSTLDVALDRIKALPGVTDVAYASVAPFGLAEMITKFEPPNAPGTEGSIRPRLVSENFFSVAGMPILSGSGFGPEHVAADSQWAVVDELFARRYFPNGDAIGGQFRVDAFAASKRTRFAQILGVTSTPRHLSADEEVTIGTVFFPLPRVRATTEILLRTNVPPETLLASVRNNLEQLLGSNRVFSVRTMDALIRRTVDDREPQLILLGVFASMTLLLTAIGLFALLSYSAQVRNAEFGLRMAMGAGHLDIGKLALREGLILVLTGLLIGTIGAWLAGRMVVDRLYQVSPADLSTWLSAGSVIALMAILASVQPTLKAIHTEPLELLRQD